MINFKKYVPKRIKKMVKKYLNRNKTEQDYILMQKKFYESSDITPNGIVGQYDWHENYPYETFLLYKYGDVRYPIFENCSDKIALDFACGPARMVLRMKKYFSKVDGCDISKTLINEARRISPDSSFYVTNGNDLGNVPVDYYDFVYCTISMQHIASYSVRMSILKQIRLALKQGGKVVLQMAYNADFPYVVEKKKIINGVLVSKKYKGEHAQYNQDDYSADSTNGVHDVGIGEKDIPLLKNDMMKYFANIDMWYSNVDAYYKNLKETVHSDYWATDWIYIFGEKE